MAMSANAVDDKDDVIGKGMIHDRFIEAEEVDSILSRVVEKADDELAKELDLERLTTILNIYQEQPNLLDSHLERMLSTCLSIVRKHDDWKVLHQVFKYMYTIAKVRGYQVIHRCMPHETSDLQPVLAMLERQSATDSANWQTRYVLLLWLSTLCLIPFDLSRFDGKPSDKASCSSAENDPATRSTMERLVAIGKQYVVESSVNRVAAFMLSTLLARPDVRLTHLGSMVDWQLATLADCDVSRLSGATRACTLLLAIATLFKKGRRAELLAQAPRVLDAVARREELEASDNILVRKFRVKVLQRCGLVFLPNRVAKWRYQRGCRSLLLNLAATGADVSNPTPTIAPDHEDEQDEEEEDFEVSSEVEEIVGMMLSALRDRDTIVRWSAAKGIGRITNRLPKSLAMDIVEALLGSCSPLDSDAAWHGACLALAELTRRGLLLPSALPDVVRVALTALRFDEKRAAHSVGAHVRDAACYVCWSLARAFDANLMREHVTSIASGLVHAFLFDREVSVRRAASAAFQENVGRQGYFPHGIEILTTCDYFAVGNLQNAYLELSVFVARFEEYGTSLVDHLTSAKIAHWDVHIRELAAKALHRLTPISPRHAVGKLPELLDACLSTELYLKHGALLAVAEILHAFALHLEVEPLGESLAACLTDETTKLDVLEACRKLPIRLAETGAFVQFGSEHLRRAVCAFIEKFSLSKVSLEDADLQRWLDLLDSCVRNNDPTVQRCAVAALRPFLSFYQHSSSCFSELVGRYRRELAEASVEYVRVGLIAALGSLPAELLLSKTGADESETCLNLVLRALIDVSRPPPEKVRPATSAARPDRYWTNARAEAVNAIISVIESCSLQRALEADCRIIETVFASLFESIGDYTIDPVKGDQGRKVREASLVGLQAFTSLVVRYKPELLTAAYCEQVFAAVAQQAVEKIIQTRALACRIFHELLHADPPLPNVPHVGDLRELFPASMKEFDWSNGAETFPLFAKLLWLPSFSYRVALGLVASIGDLGEFRTDSSSALIYLLCRSSLERNTSALRAFCDVFEKFGKNERVTLPLMRTLQQLFSNGSLYMYEFSNVPLPPSVRPFVEQLMRIITLARNEINRSLSTSRIFAAVDLYCEMLQFWNLDEQLHQRALTQLFILMAHTDIPRVRSTTANKLYEALMLYGEGLLDVRCSMEEADEINILLVETAWDFETVEQCRVVRNRICDLFHIPHPVMQQRAT